MGPLSLDIGLRETVVLGLEVDALSRPGGSNPVLPLNSLGCLGPDGGVRDLVREVGGKGGLDVSVSIEGELGRLVGRVRTTRKGRGSWSRIHRHAACIGEGKAQGHCISSGPGQSIDSGEVHLGGVRYVHRSRADPRKGVQRLIDGCGDVRGSLIGIQAQVERVECWPTRCRLQDNRVDEDLISRIQVTPSHHLDRR